MKKKLSALVLATFLFSGVGTISVYAHPHQDPPPDDQEWQDHHDRHWQENHHRQWEDHQRAWRDHDREWRDHDGDRDWQERHAHEWNDWYRWHHDNGDDGFNQFIMGVATGIILSGGN